MDLQSPDCSRNDFMLTNDHTTISAGTRSEGRRQHPLQDAVTQHESMKQRGARVQADEGEKRLGAEFMSRLEQAADGRIRRQQRRHLPDEQHEGTAMKHDVAEACDRLH